MGFKRRIVSSDFGKNRCAVGGSTESQQKRLSWLMNESFWKKHFRTTIDREENCFSDMVLAERQPEY